VGLSDKGRKSVVSNLEAGIIPNPCFSTIVYYLLACGTPVGRFCDRFNPLGLLQVDPGTFEDTESDSDVNNLGVTITLAGDTIPNLGDPGHVPGEEEDRLLDDELAEGLEAVALHLQHIDSAGDGRTTDDERRSALAVASAGECVN
jgi:hypothetical protein